MVGYGYIYILQSLYLYVEIVWMEGILCLWFLSIISGTSKIFLKLFFMTTFYKPRLWMLKKKSLTLQVLVLAALKRIPKMINHFLKKMKTYFPLWDSFTLFFKVSRKKTPKYLTQNTGNILENDYTLLLSHGIL